MTTYTDGIGAHRCQDCLRLIADCRCARPPHKDHKPMFTPNTPMILTDVTFTTETVDEETRRIVVCTFGIVPFTGAMAEDLNVRSLLFDSITGQPKEAIETIVLHVDMDLQRMAFAMAPDQGDHRVVINDCQLEPKIRCKVKHDRDPLMVDATLKVSFHYPTASELLYIANGVNDTHYMTFDTMQRDLLDDDTTADEVRPGIFAEH